MRVKLIANIISKTDNEKVFYNHELYSALLSLLPIELSKKIHDEYNGKKTLKFFTFSNIYMHDNKQKCHFYISGLDNFILEIIKNIENNNIFRLGDCILNIQKIFQCEDIPKKRNYLLKGNIIASELLNNKKRLIEEDELLEKRIEDISYKKLKKLGIEGTIEINVIKKKFHISKYKDNLIASYKSLFLIKGDYNAIKTLYDIGFGENTATGHGLCWEV